MMSITKYMRQSPDAMLNFASELVLGADDVVPSNEPENEERTE
jgi:hypothetical protein